MGASLSLAAEGCRVVVVDRDALEAAVDPDAAFEFERRGAPQVRHTHGLLARLTGTLRDRFPTVLEDLLSAGGVEIDLAQRFGDRQDGDENFRVLLARRTTLEWALRRAVSAEPAITVRGGDSVDSLVGEGRRVSGVRLASGEDLPTSFVVDAGGRRSALKRWLAELGIDLHEEEHDTGIVYLTRWYQTKQDCGRVLGGEELVKLGGDLGYLFYLAVPADKGTFSVTMAIGAEDARLRSQLLVPESFDRATSILPLPEGLVDNLTPFGPVHPMGGLVNRMRRFVSDAGEPIVEGLHAAGDSHTCTNPIYGRGCSLALVQAVALAEAFAEHPEDAAARSRAYERACRAQTEPWYELSVQTDAARTARARALAEGSDTNDNGANPLDRLFELGSDDPLLGRAILKAVNLLATPQELMSDPAVVSRALALAAESPETEPSSNRWLRDGPSRKEMLALTAA
jgi:2-polyprenyl-6-methoxyphenol hydroxylase-like FAD-dependent oxidoreductase